MFTPQNVKPIMVHVQHINHVTDSVCEQYTGSLLDFVPIMDGDKFLNVGAVVMRRNGMLSVVDLMGDRVRILSDQEWENTDD